MYFFILTVLLRQVLILPIVVAQPSPWMYEQIHLLSENPRTASASDRVKKFQIPATNASQQNDTKTKLPKKLLDAAPQQIKKHGVNQTDGVAKLYSFLKFTSSQGKVNGTGSLKRVSSESAATKNKTVHKTSTLTADASPSVNNSSLTDNDTAVSRKIVTEGLSAANATSAFDSKFEQQSPKAIVGAPSTLQTTGSAASHQPSVVTHVRGKGSLNVSTTIFTGTSAKAMSVQPPRSGNAPSHPLEYRLSGTPGSPNNYLSSSRPVPISVSRSYVAAQLHSYIPKNQAAFRAPVPNQAVLRPPIRGQPRYTLNPHAVLRSPIPGQPRYTLNPHTVLRSPIPGQLNYTPNRRPVYNGAPRHTPYLPYARKQNVPNKFPLAMNAVQHRYGAPNRGPIYGNVHNRLRSNTLPYVRRQNVPYSYLSTSKNSRPFFPGQKRSYTYGNVRLSRVNSAPLPQRFYARPAYISHQAPARRFTSAAGLRG